VLEKAYNMWFALHDYSFDSDCDLFLRILQGKMDEQVYVDQMHMLAKLQITFEKADEDIHAGVRKNELSKEILKSIFIDFFPVKSEKETQDCFKKLEKEFTGELVPYLEIFAEDADGNQGPFIEKVREQHLNDREEPNPNPNPNPNPKR